MAIVKSPTSSVRSVIYFFSQNEDTCGLALERVEMESKQWRMEIDEEVDTSCSKELEEKGTLLFQNSLRDARELLAKHPDSAILQYCPLVLPSYAQAHIREHGTLESICHRIAETSPNEFCWSTCFDPDFLADVLYEGFFTYVVAIAYPIVCHFVVSMGIEVSHGIYDTIVVAPKIHTNRCVIDLEDFRVSKSVRRYARDYTCSMDLAFKEVCEGITNQHGESWFFPRLVESFRLMHERGKQKCGLRRKANGRGVVAMHSFELWKKDKLVAGEVGVQVGKIYISFSGFSAVKNSGMVQLCTLAAFLHESSIEMWDLGMEIDYKLSMGGRILSRGDFLRRFRTLRGYSDIDLALSETNAKEVIMKRRRHILSKTITEQHAHMKGETKSGSKRKRRQRERKEWKTRKHIVPDVIQLAYSPIRQERLTFVEGCPIIQKVEEILLDCLRRTVCKVLGITLSQIEESKALNDVLSSLSLAPRSQFSKKQPHYQCAIAMRLFKVLKSMHLPVYGDHTLSSVTEFVNAWGEIICQSKSAQETIGALQVNFPKQGFLYIYLRTEFVQYLLNTFECDPRSKDSKSETVLLDYASPNIAKKLHVGHLRSTLIGNALQRILTFRGYNVLSVNHVGDWGTQFGMLIAYILKSHSSEQIEILLNSPHHFKIETLTKFYRAAKERFDNDSEFAREAKMMVVRLQMKDEVSVQYRLWNSICEVSRREYSQIFDLLDIRIKEMGESFYSTMLDSCVESLVVSGIAKTNRNIVFVGSRTNPIIIRKSDGAYGYMATDLAAMRYRFNDMNANRIYYVTGDEQSNHFSNLFKIASAAGWLIEDSKESSGAKAEHIGFGLVKKSDGRRFRTRSGETLDLINLLNEAIRSSAEKLKTFGPAKTRAQNNYNHHKMPKSIGISLVKYAELRRCRQKSYVFKFDEMTGNIADSKNTAWYLLYTHCRAKALLNGVSEKSLQSGSIKLVHESELELAFEILQFGRILELALSKKRPDMIAKYCYRIALCFNRFYHACSVKTGPMKVSREKIVSKFCKALRTSLDLLGIVALDRM